MSSLEVSGFSNFYPRPPRGGRPLSLGLVFWILSFLSTPSARRATRSSAASGPPRRNFYPRPPRGGRPGSQPDALTVQTISIHALREEGDGIRQRWPSAQRFLSTPSARRATSVVRALDTMERFLSTPSARRATAKTETKSLFSYKLYNILHEFRRALIYNGSKNDPNHAKRLKNPVRRCRKNAENSPFAPGRKTQNNSRPSCSKGG